MTSSQQTPAVRPRVYKASLGLAAVAWGAVCVVTYMREPSSILIMSIGFPVIYGLGLGICWFIATYALAVDSSAFVGPRKDLQVKCMVAWCNTVVILFPAAVLIAAVLGICGIMPTKQ